MIQGSAEGIKEKPSVPKSAGGSQTSSRNSTSSLAVFYVEQVALNRHVSPQQAAQTLMTGSRPVVNRFRFAGIAVGPSRRLTQNCPLGLFLSFVSFCYQLPTVCRASREVKPKSLLRERPMHRKLGFASAFTLAVSSFFTPSTSSQVNGPSQVV